MTIQGQINNTDHKEPSERILLLAGGGCLNSPSAVQLEDTGPSSTIPVLHKKNI